MIGIFYFSSRPDPLSSVPSPGYGISLGNLAHIVEYAGFAALLHRAISNERPESSDQQNNQRANPQTSNPSSYRILFSPLGVSSLAAFAYAIFDELHQEFVPGRGFELTDLGYDLAGIAVALTLVRVYHCLQQSPNKE